MADPTPIDDLQQAWPGWRFWLTDADNIMATRRRYLTPSEIEAGLALTLPTGVFGPPLVEQLAKQQAIESQFKDSVDAGASATDGEG